MSKMAVRTSFDFLDGRCNDKQRLWLDCFKIALILDFCAVFRQIHATIRNLNGIKGNYEKITFVTDNGFSPNIHRTSPWVLAELHD